MKKIALIVILFAATACADDIDPHAYVTSGRDFGIVSPDVEVWVIYPDVYESAMHLENPVLTDQITLDGALPTIEIDSFGNVVEPID